MKENRQRLIVDIISLNDIETQNQLLDALAAAGVTSTQATISRDIKELRLVKELSPRGNYRYALPGVDGTNHSDRLKSIFRECIVSFATARNIVVLKTLPGLASAACSAIDGMDEKDLVGSLAGDDTAFLAMRDEESAERFCRELKQFV